MSIGTLECYECGFRTAFARNLYYHYIFEHQRTNEEAYGLVGDEIKRSRNRYSFSDEEDISFQRDFFIRN